MQFTERGFGTMTQIYKPSAPTLLSSLFLFLSTSSTPQDFILLLLPTINQSPISNRTVVFLPIMSVYIFITVPDAMTLVISNAFNTNRLGDHHHIAVGKSLGVGTMVL
jgi:hypothetical protein